MGRRERLGDDRAAPRREGALRQRAIRERSGTFYRVRPRLCEWLFVSRVCGREISGVREQRRAANRRARVRVAWQKSEGEERARSELPKREQNKDDGFRRGRATGRSSVLAATVTMLPRYGFIDVTHVPGTKIGLGPKAKHSARLAYGPGVGGSFESPCKTEYYAIDVPLNVYKPCPPRGFLMPPRKRREPKC